MSECSTFKAFLLHSFLNTELNMYITASEIPQKCSGSFHFNLLFVIAVLELH